VVSAFEFFFSLYGLVLGLSVVEIVSGFARLAHDRRGVKVGILVPMLALLMLLDLANFWVSAYARLQASELSYAVLVVALGISALYYVAASVVFPRDFAAEPDFDAVYLRHRRLVMGVLIATGLLAFEALPLLIGGGASARLFVWSDPLSEWQTIAFIACALAVMVVKNKLANLALLALLMAPYVYNFAAGISR
jgi:hypothetical protein